MRVGINLPVMVPGLDRNLTIEWARRIEAGPFSSLCAGERVNFPNPEVLVTLATAAAVTERVKIVPTVMIVPMHPPVLLAKQLATLDVMSGGRLVLGVGVGARPDDFVAAEAEFAINKMKRMEEYVAIMRRVWSGEHIVKGAEHPAEPRPLQPNGPEILVGALSLPSIRRAARWADGITGFSFGPSPDEVRFAADAARTAWRDAGRATAPRLTTSFWYALGPGGREQLDTYLLRYLNFVGADVARALAPTVRTDSAAVLRDQLEVMEDLGMDEVFLVPTTLDPDDVLRVEEIIG